MTETRQHEKCMRRCLDLAIMGKGNVEPNPMVGSVIVHNGLIVGEGFHQQYGEAHAEINAMESVKKKELLKNSTLYVNLEPCSHFGKTPPCTNAIIENKIPRVVIGAQDTHIEVAGKGIQHLKENGVEVVLNVLEEECKKMNIRFFTFHNKKRPYIILKWAQSLDGFIDIIRNEDIQKGTWLTNETCRALVHKWRAEEAGILIGSKTAKMDNPSLNIRSWKGKDPMRIVIDQEGDIPMNLSVFDTEIPTICYSSTMELDRQNLVFKKIDFSNNAIDFILNDLYEKDIQSVIVEGGAETIMRFYESGKWDEIRLFIGNKILQNGIQGPQIKGQLVSTEKIGDSSLWYFMNENNL